MFALIFLAGPILRGIEIAQRLFPFTHSGERLLWARDWDRREPFSKTPKVTIYAAAPAESEQ